MFIGISNAVTRGENVWGPLGLFANGAAGASWNVLGFSTIGEPITSITDSSGNDITLANAVTAQQPAYDETEDGIKYAFFDLDDSLSATLPDLGTDASKWTITPYAVHIETGQTIGAGSYTAPTNDWGAHGVIDREVTATEINRIVAWAKRNKLTGVDYPTLKTRMDVICMNAVDVFVYDTSKDSDGGAWRTGALAQASSWYNETLNTATRGSRREFPAVAVIVAESNKVTIYDGDDPALPMWMVFIAAGGLASDANIIPGDTVTAVVARNGVIAISTNNNAGGRGGLNTIRLISEHIDHKGISNLYRDYDGNIAERNTGKSYSIGDNNLIVNAVINDIAVTVLPDAPIDPATGLPVPTIAVATDGGVSVIKDDGTVVDSADTVAQVAVAFRDDGTLFYRRGGGRISFATTYSADGFGSIYTEANYTLAPAPRALNNVGKALLASNSALAFGQNSGSSPGLLLFNAANASSFAGEMAAEITSTYNTGWMVGDVKGAFLADTDDTDLVGNNLYTSDFSSTVDGWTAQGQATLAVVSGELEVTGDGGYNDAGKKAFTTVSGKSYVIRGQIRRGTATTARIQVQEGFGSFVVTASYESTSATLEDFTLYFTAGGTIYDLSLVDWTGAGGTVYVANVTIDFADADRSVNNKGLVVSGSITRSPVATGAELVAYSGFSASNYLEQPYNPALNFGTGDFCVMGWVYNDGTGSTQYLFSRGNTGGDWRGIAALRRSASGTQFVDLYAGGASVTTTEALPVGWTLLTLKRESGILKAFFNKNLQASASNTSNVGTGEGLKIGGQYGGSGSFGAGSLALFRISATAPTAAQIAKIYEDELPLFQEKAACTLAGSGDAVTALAHDPTTGVLRVAQSDKTSLFIGLERVGEEDGKATCIASVNGIVAGI